MKTLIILALILSFILVIEIFRELHVFRVTHYDIYTEKLSKNMKEKKVVLLSDLHNCVYGKENDRLIQAVKKQNPDIILIAGDMLISSRSCPLQVAEKFVSAVASIAPVYYSTGNHEQRVKEWTDWYGDKYKEYKENLMKAGVTFLEDSSCSLYWENDKVRITGFELPLSYYKKFTKEFVPKEELCKKLGETKKDTYEILIAHNPVHAGSYAGWGADLTVSGHLHGGIVRIPFWRGAVTPQAVLFPKYSGGNYRVANMDLVVSRGLGTHTINIRLFNEAEVVTLHIRGTK